MSHSASTLASCDRTEYAAASRGAATIVVNIANPTRTFTFTLCNVPVTGARASICEFEASMRTTMVPARMASPALATAPTRPDAGAGIASGCSMATICA